MINIEGINYSILLLIDGIDGKNSQEHVFSDFSAMNSFIQSNKDHPEYAHCHVEYTLVETNDTGECGSYSWTKTIAFREFSDDDIRKAIEAQQSWLSETSELSKNLDNYMKSINYLPNDSDYQEKRARLEEFTYVCPFCIRELEDCRCRHYPYYLMQIDRKILPVIRELNSKGYKTTGCCAGHPNQEEFKSAGIYICFDRDYDFDEPFPEGSEYFKSKHSLSIIPPETCDDLNLFQQEAIWRLSDWAEMLFDLSDDFYDSFED